MNFKKTIAKSLVVAMALGMVPVANLQTAKAADDVTITFDGTTGTATAANGLFWGLAKEDPKGVKLKDTKTYKITNIQDFVGEIDLYSALKGKAGILVAGKTAVPGDTWVAKKIPEADKTLKVQFIATASAVKKGPKPSADKLLGGEFGYIYVTNGKTPAEFDLSTADNQEKVEVKLNEGNWKTFKDFFDTEGGKVKEDSVKVNKKLQAYGQSGSTLTFRMAGVKQTNTVEGAWAGKEVKIKVATQAKAPNVKLDITKETTSIKSGIEWKAVASDANEADVAWKLSEDRKGISLDKLGLEATKAYTLLVRNAANAKKIASKVGRITINLPANAANGITVGTGNKVTGTGAAIKQGAKEIATINTSLAYDITKGAVLTNKSATDIEYALVTASVDGFKWNTRKDSKDPEKKPSKTNLKYSKTAKANTWTDAAETKIYVRLAGTKQTKDNVVTRSGVSVGAVLALKNIEQKVTLAAGTVSDAAKVGVTVSNATTSAPTTASIQIATGTAATVTLKGTITNTVNPKGGTPKLTAVSKLPSGVTIKAGKINPADGTFEITLNVSKSAFKGDTISADAKYTLKYEGAEDSFAIKFSKKA